MYFTFIQVLLYYDSNGKVGIGSYLLMYIPYLLKKQFIYHSNPQLKVTYCRYLIIPLHSVLASDEQNLAFVSPPAGVRKVVLATNIAEKGITIPDVVFVIDSGKVKEKRWELNVK